MTISWGEGILSPNVLNFGDHVCGVLKDGHLVIFLVEKSRTLKRAQSHTHGRITVYPRFPSARLPLNPPPSPPSITCLPRRRGLLSDRYTPRGRRRVVNSKSLGTRAFLSRQRAHHRQWSDNVFKATIPFSHSRFPVIFSE